MGCLKMVPKSCDTKKETAASLFTYNVEKNAWHCDNIVHSAIADTMSCVKTNDALQYFFKYLHDYITKGAAFRACSIRRQQNAECIEFKF